MPELASRPVIMDVADATALMQIADRFAAATAVAELVQAAAVSAANLPDALAYGPGAQALKIVVSLAEPAPDPQHLAAFTQLLPDLKRELLAQLARNEHISADELTGDITSHLSAGPVPDRLRKPAPPRPAPRPRPYVSPVTSQPRDEHPALGAPAMTEDQDDTEPTPVGLVAQLSLVHDLVEVYAGDTPTITIDAAGVGEKERREAAAAQRLEQEFSTSLSWIPTTITSYEQQAGPEARFVKAVDKLLPKITHLLNGGATLTDQGITRTELDQSWTRQGRALAGYAGDFPELLDLLGELVAAISATCTAAAEGGQAS